MHPEAMEWCRKWASDQHGHALDVGGRNVNGTARGLWPNMQWTVLDVAGDPGNHLDRIIQADATSWLPDRAYDLVLSTELLEHVRPWRECVATMVTAMSANGFLVITCAGPGRKPHSMDDGGDLPEGEHYHNVNPVVLTSFLSGECGLLGVDVDVCGPDVRAIASRKLLT